MASTTPLLSKGIHPAISQGCADHRQIFGTHVEGALFGVQVSRLSRIKIDPAIALQQARDALVAKVRLRGAGINLLVQWQLSPGKAGQAVVNEFPLRLDGRARHET